ncbi:MAG TPA: serine hydrolase domain-containing protein [Longimicrobiales bacterium]|nr:serine hydrolase domain-containing protein [Longimicrobiales bacterium]
MLTTHASAAPAHPRQRHALWPLHGIAAAGAAAGLALLAACSPEPPAPPPSPDEIAAGLRPAVQLEGEEPMVFSLEERMAHYNVPGVSVAVLDGGEVAWARGWGIADLEAGTPVTPETLFQAASISKPVAGLAAMTLVSDGTLALDAPVNEFMTSWRVPDNEFTADSAVTLRGILTHSAGLTVWGFPGYRKDEPFGDQELASNVQVLDGLGNTDPVRVYKVPGTSWQYSGGGYTVMEQLLEDATGKPFEEVARERVLDPAGMTRSTYAQPLLEARWAEAARGHREDGSEVEGEWHNYPEQAAAGLWTTPTDLLTLSAHLLGILDGSVTDGILSREAVEAVMTPNHPGDDAFRGWGLGFALNGEGEARTFGHGGSNEGFKAQWIVYPERGQGVAVMTNGDRGSALAAEIIRSVSEAYGWPGHKSEIRAARALTPDEAAAYAGSYLLPDSELTVVVRAGDGVLEADVPGQGTVVLHAAAGEADVFFDRTDSQVLTFRRGEDGAITALATDSGLELVRQAPEA